MNSESKRRVVITGVGIVSPIGIGVAPFWENLAAGRSGIGPIESLEYTAAPDNIGGEIKDFTESSARKVYLKRLRKNIKLMCREIQFGVTSALLALDDSGLNLDEIDSTRFGVEFGANLMFSPPSVLNDPCMRCVHEDGFHFDDWGQTGLTAMEPLWLLRYLPNMPACHIGIAADARGPNNSITLDDASGNLVLGEAASIMRRGAADVIIAGSTGTRLHPVKTMHSQMWDELASTPDDPAKRCRPFDRDRAGQVVAEGAGAFVLETAEHAEKRGAQPLAAILGTGSSCVISRQGTPNRTEALVRAMRGALQEAGLSPEQIGHINAHGSGDPTEDRQEAAAIVAVFGEQPQVPVTAIKSFLGNSGSGSGVLELAASVIGLSHGVVPHTLNYETPDPDCPLNVVHGEPLATDNRTTLSINVTRFGQASAVITGAA